MVPPAAGLMMGRGDVIFDVSSAGTDLAISPGEPILVPAPQGRLPRRSRGKGAVVAPLRVPGCYRFTSINFATISEI